MLMLRRAKVKVVRTSFEVGKSARVGAGVSVAAAWLSCVGNTYGIPAVYAKAVAGLEVQVTTKVRGGTVTTVKSYVFVGDATLFRNRVSNYNVTIPASPAAADALAKAIRKAVEAGCRYTRAVFMVGQAPSEAALGLIRSAYLRAMPWGKVRYPHKLPPHDTVRAVTDGLAYGDVRVWADGEERGLDDADPVIEMAVAIPAEDVSSFVYVANPLRLVTYYETHSPKTVSLADVIKEALEDAREGKG